MDLRDFVAYDHSERIMNIPVAERTQVRTFETLPLLEACVGQPEFRKRFDGGDVVIIGAQHLLATTGSLFMALCECGVAPQNVFLLGKHYSTNHQTVQILREAGVNVTSGVAPGWGASFRESFLVEAREMWRRAIAKLGELKNARVVVLDDGGAFVETAPWPELYGVKVVAVEQTTSGIERIEAGDLKVTVIDVARSWAKTTGESGPVGEAIVEGLKHSLGWQMEGGRFGVVGIGNIGKAVAAELAARRFLVSGYDSGIVHGWPDAIRRVMCLEELVDKVDVVVGCSGKDIFNGCGDGLPWVGRKILVSCSSEDVEFLSLLKQRRSEEKGGVRETLDALHIRKRNAEAIILRGGYPVNFDGGMHSVAAVDIQLTRALLFIGVVQGLGCLEQEPNMSEIVMLDPLLQVKLFLGWKTIQGKDLDMSYEAAVAKCERGSRGVRKECGIKWVEDGEVPRLGAPTWTRQ